MVDYNKAEYKKLEVAYNKNAKNDPNRRFLASTAQSYNDPKA